MRTRLNTVSWFELASRSHSLPSHYPSWNTPVHFKCSVIVFVAGHVVRVVCDWVAIPLLGLGGDVFGFRGRG
jgi:hypothetical protein